MSIGDALRRLAALVDAVDELGAEVVEAQPGEIDDDEFVADIRLRVPLDGGMPVSDWTARDGAVGPERAETAHNSEQPEADFDSPRTGTATDAMATFEGEEGLAAPAPAGTDGGDVRGEPDETVEAARPTGSAEGDPEVETTEEDEAVEAGTTADPEETDGTDEPEKTDGTDEPEKTDGTDEAQIDQPSETSADDEVVCTFEGCSERFDSEHGMRIHRSKAHDQPAAYRDPEALATVYEEQDSFAAMRDALGVDVSAQTVRKQMIEHGIHTPNRSRTYRTRADSGSESPSEGSGRTGGEGADDDEANEANGANGSENDPSEETTELEDGTVSESPDAEDVEEDEEPVGLEGEIPADSEAGDEEAGDHDGESDPEDVSDTDTDSSSLPDSMSETDSESASESASESDWACNPEIAEALPSTVTPAELRDAVAAATTLYEVQKRLGLEREETRRLLSDLDLLELVHGRVADQRRREELKAELEDRLGTASRPAESSSD